MPLDKATFQVALVGAGLARVTKDIDYLVRDSIRLHTTAVDEQTLQVGASKLGGLPDLPAGTAWPEWQGVPQSFIAQIRLDDAHPYDTQRLLPASGMLWFFYDAKQQTYGDQPSDKGGWSVLFSDNVQNKLSRATAPNALPASSRFHACSIRFASEITVSQQPELDISHFDWTQAEQQQYEKLLSTLYSQQEMAEPHNRMLGFADTIQDDMRSQCQLVSHGITDSSDPRAQDLLKTANDWLLLLQVDSDEQANMRWGDTGMLYYWITSQNLQAKHFDSTWLVLQSE
jgi:uncharacterized protein YwqG